MIAVEIFIPLSFEENAAFDVSHHLAFDRHLVAIFGGGYRVLDAVRDDATRIYAVAVASLESEGAKVRLLVDVAKLHYSRPVIFVRYQGEQWHLQ